MDRGLGGLGPHSHSLSHPQSQSQAQAHAQPLSQPHSHSQSNAGADSAASTPEGAKACLLPWAASHCPGAPSRGARRPRYSRSFGLALGMSHCLSLPQATGKSGQCAFALAFGQSLHGADPPCTRSLFHDPILPAKRTHPQQNSADISSPPPKLARTDHVLEVASLHGQSLSPRTPMQQKRCPDDGDLECPPAPRRRLLPTSGHSPRQPCRRRL